MDHRAEDMQVREDLLSRPEAWTQAVNGLLADPTIRKNYQFWLYLYPTGLPVWRSAAALRDELDRFDARLSETKPDTNLNRIILIAEIRRILIEALTQQENPLIAAAKRSPR
jgi:hypothetical protein